MTAKKHRRRPWIVRHLSRIGFTNRLAVGILIMISLGLLGGFYLAIESIQSNYSGSLMCWTVVFTPIGTASSIVLAKVVDKNKAENTSGDIGITFAAAQANNFIPYDDDVGQGDAPTI